MSIKTDELQRLTSVQGTDSILMANSAGGTTQLPIEDLARFLAEQDNAVRTALSSKAALSAQETLEKTAVSSRSITLKAEELPAYIASLPRLLTEYLTINVSGALTETLEINGFYGCGSIHIKGKNECVVRNISVRNCAAPSYFDDLTIGAGQLPDEVLDVVSVRSSVRTHVSNSIISGGPKLHGFIAIESFVRLSNVSIKNCMTAVLAENNSIVSVSRSGDEYPVYEGNNTGAYVWHGGIVLLSSSIPDLLGGNTNLKYGGIIAKADGTLL